MTYHSPLIFTIVHKMVRIDGLPELCFNLVKVTNRGKGTTGHDSKPITVDCSLMPEGTLCSSPTGVPPLALQFFGIQPVIITINNHTLPARIVSFKDTLLQQTRDDAMDMILGEVAPSDDDELESPPTRTTNSDTPIIHLNATIKARIRQPWINSISAFFSNTIIAPRLNGIWRPVGIRSHSTDK
ncbi:hypothetical protein RJ639_046112 [Escallonia herrerae]|uniref:Uncharacterized protein n=1 Tax=Escallonia herrerae TaxID=1293975 RepID=A0AA89B3Z4_9ASTE|nr:hypothetical protein RJ639_046112 [Escallonia herrerae]